MLGKQPQQRLRSNWEVVCIGHDADKRHAREAWVLVGDPQVYDGSVGSASGAALGQGVASPGATAKNFAILSGDILRVIRPRGAQQHHGMCGFDAGRGKPDTRNHSWAGVPPFPSQAPGTCTRTLCVLFACPAAPILH